jgi:hypothetical protein
MTDHTGCPWCRAIRRILMTVAIGGTMGWLLTGVPPLGVGGDTWRGLTLVLTLFMLATVFARMHQLRRRWRR